MSLATIILWPSVSGNDAIIASQQTLAAAGDLVINTNPGTQNPYAYPVSTQTIPMPYGSFYMGHMARTISVYGDDLSGVTITVEGLGSPVDGDGNPTQLLNTPISEDINGANGTAFSTNIYTRLDRISLDDSGTNVQAGFGTSGITTFIFPDYDRKSWYAACSVQVLDADGITYTAYQSLNKPSYPSATQGNLVPFIGGEIPAFEVATNMTAATDNQIAQLDFPIATLWLSIADTSGDSLIFTFLQQGIR